MHNKILTTVTISRVIGVIIIVGGLYLVLWGKEQGKNDISTTHRNGSEKRSRYRYRVNKSDTTTLNHEIVVFLTGL